MSSTVRSFRKRPRKPSMDNPNSISPPPQNTATTFIVSGTTGDLPIQAISPVSSIKQEEAPLNVNLHPNPNNTTTAASDAPCSVVVSTKKTKKPRVKQGLPTPREHLNRKAKQVRSYRDMEEFPYFMSSQPDSAPFPLVAVSLPNNASSHQAAPALPTTSVGTHLDVQGFYEKAINVSGSKRSSNTASSGKGKQKKDGFQPKPAPNKQPKTPSSNLVKPQPLNWAPGIAYSSGMSFFNPTQVSNADSPPVSIVQRSEQSKKKTTTKKRKTSAKEKPAAKKRNFAAAAPQVPMYVSPAPQMIDPAVLAFLANYIARINNANNSGYSGPQYNVMGLQQQRPAFDPAAPGGGGTQQGWTGL